VTDIWTLIDWFFYGFVRYVLFWIPLLTPFSVDRHIPWQWWRYNGIYDWWHKNDNNGGPDEHWLQAWFRMVFGEALLTATESAKPYIDALRTWAEAVIGGVQVGMGSLGRWAQKLDDWIGGWVPLWAGSLSGGLLWLRDRLPAAIRYGWQSWGQIWQAIKDDVKDWVRGYVDLFRQMADTALSWTRDTGQRLDQWYRDVSGWLAGVRSAPYEWIAGWLGWTWTWLRGFSVRGRDQVLEWMGPNIGQLLLFGRDCVRFYYQLWAVGWCELGEFVEDPRHYVVDLLERVLVERW